MDVWGHLAFGRYILENKNIPIFDVFSYTAEGKIFYNFSWFFQAIIYSIYLLGGILSLIVTKAIIILFTFSLIFLIGYKKIPLIFWLFVLLVSIFNAQGRFLVRPEIFSFLFVTIYFFFLFKYIEEDKKWIYFLPLLQLIWVNIHSLSIIGPVILLIYFIGECMIKKVPLPFKWNEQGKLNRRRIKEIFIITLACIVVSFITPYGYRIFDNYTNMLITVKTHSEVSPGGIQELQPISINIFNFMNKNLVYFKILMITCFLFIFLNIKRQHISISIIFLVSLFLAKMNIRNIGFFSIIACFTFFQNAKDIFNKENLSVLKKYKIYYALNIIIFFIIVSGSFFILRKIWDRDTYIDGKIIKRAGIGKAAFYPEGAVNFIKRNKLKGNMFNSFGFGHYLIWKLYPERKVFIDGRLGLYQDDIFNIYTNSFTSLQYSKQVINKYNINYFIIPTSISGILSKFLYQSSQWKLVYFDPIAVIYVKNKLQNKSVIKKYEINLDNWRKKLQKLKQINKKYYSKYKPDFISFINEGLFFKHIEEFKYAKLAFKESMNINPDSLDSYLQLSNIYILEEDYKKAIQVLVEATGKGLSSKILYSNLAYSYENVGNKDKAIYFYKKACSRWGGVPVDKACSNLARMYYEKGLYKKALVEIEKAIEFNPHDYLNYYSKGTIYIYMGLYDIALDYLQKSIKLNPEFAKAYNNLALCYFRLGMIKKAENILHKALNLDPTLQSSKKLLKEIRKIKHQD